MKKHHIETVAELQRFSPTVQNGLTSEQVDRRIKDGLINHVNKKYSKSYLSIFVGNICTFFNLLGLIVAIALATINTKISDYFFVIIYLANIAIGIIQEIRAKHCIEKLSIMSDKKIKVIRNSEQVEIFPREIVLDDVVYLGLGSQIPCDGTVLEGEIEVNESLLTGESVPVKKRAGDPLFAGSFIISGTCYIQATKVGKDNYVETLSAKAKKYKKPRSELIGSIHLFIKIISCIIVPIATISMIKALSGGLTRENYEIAVGGTSHIVLGMIPSGMILLTSLALAVGVIKLATHKTLVQDLYSLEMLARVDTICFDKTGTITDGNMSVKEIVEIENSEYKINELMSSMLGALKDENQTATALKNYFGQDSIFKETFVLPFNSARKLSAVAFEKLGTFAFGAPEFVLSPDIFKTVQEKVNEYTLKGMRVLVLAKSDSTLTENIVPTDFKPIALLIIEDHVREDAIQTIKWFKENNVAIKVISGDNPITVSEVSKRVGIQGAENYVSLENLTDEQVYEIADKYTVFGRVSPDQKAILVKALRDAGHVTAMTGDGVNDILALKEADCAITVASGSDAARNVSHIVLLDNNFNSMPKVVHEGRRVINNVKSSASLFIMKTLFNMIMALIVLLAPGFPTSPFDPSHTILLEVFVIGLPSFFLSMQENDALVEGKFFSYVLVKSLPSALLMLLSTFIVHWFALAHGGSIMDEPYKSMAVYVFTFAGVISLFLICAPFNKLRAVIFGANTVAIMVAISIAIFFGFDFLGLSALTPLSENWKLLLIVLGIMVVDIPLLPLIQLLCKKIKLPEIKHKVKHN